MSDPINVLRPVYDKTGKEVFKEISTLNQFLQDFLSDLDTKCLDNEPERQEVADYLATTLEFMVLIRESEFKSE